MPKVGDFALPVFGVAVACAIVGSELVVKKKAEPDRVHITYWEKWTEFEGDAIRQVVNDFNQSQNKIHVDLLTVSNIEGKTLMSISAGIPPDVAGLYGSNVAQYVDDHAIMPLDDYCKEAGITRDNYKHSFFDIGVYKGHVWSLPTAPASTALHYNCDMFVAAGLDPNKPPQTLEEMDKAVNLLTKRNGKDIEVAGFLPAEPGWWNWAWGYYFGGALWDGKDKITANSPENIRAFQWVQDFSTKYGKSEVQTFKSGFGSFSSPQNAFMDKKVAMELQGVWMYNFITKYRPSLKWAASPFPHPANRPDLANMTMIDEDIICIPRGSKHPKEAWEFIKYVESQKGMETLCMLQRKQLPLAKASPEFFAKHPNPYIKLFDDLDRSPNAIPPPKIGIWPEYMSELNNAFDKIGLVSASPKDALDAVTKRMQPKLDQYLRRRAQREKVFGE